MLRVLLAPSYVSGKMPFTEEENRSLPHSLPKEKLPMTSLGTAVINFTPSWFSVNMGTGILSILLHTAPHKFYGMDGIAAAVYLINCGLFAVFLGLSVARYILYPFVIRRLMKHSAQSMFLGTIPMGLATIINATVLIAVPRYGAWARVVAETLWWIDVVLSVMTSFGVPFLMFQLHNLSLEKMTGAWLLPVVPTVVAAASGGLLATVLQSEHAVTVIVVSYILWGIGMGTSFLIMALYFHRLTIHHLPDAEVVVSAFLPLGPLGQGTFGLIQLSQAGKVSFEETGFLGQSAASQIIFVISTIVGIMLWGFGCWWLVHGIYSVLTRSFYGRLKFNMGFWGFIFPLGVFTSATIALAKALPSAFFGMLSMVFIACLVLLYIGVALGTLFGTFNRSLLVAPCLTDLYSAQRVSNAPVST